MTTLICAHRGASLDLPDNSIAAFEAAIESGCEAIETDVRRAPDGRLVLAHDREDAARPDAVALENLIELARSRIGLDLELKEAGLEAELLAAVEGGRDWLLVTSFMPGVVSRIGELAPAVRTGLLVEAAADGGDGAPADGDAHAADDAPKEGEASIAGAPTSVDGAPGPADAVATARACGADALLVEDPMLGPELARDAAVAGLGLWSWTVNDAERIERLLADSGVEGLITNDPLAAVRLRAARSAAADA